MILRLQTFFLSIVMAIGLCLGFAGIAYADDGSIQLNARMTATAETDSSYTQTGGSVEPTSITLQNGKITNLPTPTSPTGWTFIGWYDKEVKTMWWNNTYGDTYNPWVNKDKGESKLPNDFKNLKNLRSTDGAWDANGCYWSYLVGSAGKKIQNGDTLDAGVHELYAAYAPTTVTIRSWWNGYQGQTGALYSYRDYGTSISPNPLNDWNGHKFLGWYTEPNGGTEVKGTDHITKDTDIYACFEGLTGDGKPEYSDAYGITINPHEVKLEPGNTVTVHAYVQTDNKGYAADNSKVQWTMKDDSRLVSFTTNKNDCTLTTKDKKKTGTVTLTAKIKNNDNSKEFSDTITVTVDHTFDTPTVVQKYPNCTEGGYGYIKCRYCDTQHKVTWEKDGHRFTYHRTNATCTEEGCEDRYCVVCGLHEHQTIQPALGHKFALKTLSTCVGKTEIKTCNTCGVTETKELSSVGEHNWATVKTVDKAASCVSEGSKSIHCLNCEETKESEVIPATNTHKYGQWKIITAATADQDGKQERTCLLCGATEDQTLPKTGSPNVTPPTTEPSTQPSNPSGDTPSVTPPTDTPATEEPPAKDESSTDVGQPEITKIYRLYNENNGSHLLTTNKTEADGLVKLGWTSEGVAGSVGMEGDPVYRLYNPYSGEHLYTNKKSEYNYLGSLGWNQEDVAWYASGDTPMYRLYNPWAPVSSNHLYTTSLEEYENCAAAGWQKEGIAWYCAA